MSDMNNTEAPKKKKFGGKLIALVIILVIILAGSITAYANRNVIANTLAMKTKSPSEYYALVEQKSLNTNIDKLTKSYEANLAKAKKGLSQNFDLVATVDPGFTELLGIDEIKTVAINGTSSSKSGKGQAAIEFSYDNTKIISMETLTDSNIGELYLRFPELSQAYLLFNLVDLMESSGEDFSYENYMDKMQLLLDGDLLSADTLNSTLKKYSALVIKNIEDVEIDKETVKASKISSDYTQLTVELDGKNLYEMSMAILEEAKDDKDLIKILTKLEVCTEDEYDELIEEAINSVEESEDDIKDTEIPMVMHVYINSAGKIMGRDFLVDDGYSKTSFGYYITKDGSDFGFTFWVGEDDEKIVEVNGKATYKNGSFSGKADFNFAQYDYWLDQTTNYAFNLEFEDVNHVKDKNFINGKFTVTSELLEGMEFIIDCSTSKDEQKINFDLLYGDIKTVTLAAKYSEGAYEDFDMPSSSEQVYDGINDTYSYLETADFDGLISKLESTLGIDDLETFVEEFMYNFMY